MLVIKNKIVGENLMIERTNAIIPTDSIGRTSAILSVNENKFLGGGSLLNCLEPTEYYLDVLRWHDLLSLSPDEIRRKFYNLGIEKLPTFTKAQMVEDINP
jgi:hypothetical protein